MLKKLLCRFSIVFLFITLIVSRCYSYFLYGPYGFGFDLGIYKREFGALAEFGDLFNSQIAFLPSFGAYLFNSFNLSLDFYLYGFYLFVAVLLGLMLFFVTRKQFGLNVAVVAIGIFIISYAQVYAVQFYLFKAVMGACILMLGLYFYSKKSYWFYLVLFLLALTQLPQFLILVIAGLLASCFDYKNYRDFVIRFWVLLLFAGGVLLVFFTEQVGVAYNLVLNALADSPSFDKHQSGYFITFSEYLRHSYWILILGIFGLFKLVKTRFMEFSIYLFAVLSLLVIILFKLFFEERYIFELDLLLIPFAAFAICYLLSFVKVSFYKWGLRLLLTAFALFFFVYYLSTTQPALQVSEIAAIQYMNKDLSVKSVLVMNSFYAPWMYGFTNKTVLSPGMFESVMSYQEWQDFVEGDDQYKSKKLNELLLKYGSFYIFEGVRDSALNLGEVDDLMDIRYSINGVKVYFYSL